MRPGPTRRGLLQGLGAGALIVGFDPAGRRWVTRRTAGAATVPVPPLKGKLLFSDAARATASDDFGHIVHHRP
jgi:hypothetical protein